MSFSNIPVDNGIFILPVQGGFIVKYHEYVYAPEFESTLPPGPIPKKMADVGGEKLIGEKKKGINAFKEHTVVCSTPDELSKLVTDIVLRKKLMAENLGQESFPLDKETGSSVDKPQAVMSSPAGVSI